MTKQERSYFGGLKFLEYSDWNFFIPKNMTPLQFCKKYGRPAVSVDSPKALYAYITIGGDSPRIYRIPDKRHLDFLHYVQYLRSLWRINKRHFTKKNGSWSVSNMS